MRKREDIDLSRAFAAPPESYIAKTRTTLEQLEEDEPVKKFTFSLALALTCALLIMGSALAVGLSGAWRTDTITGQQGQTLSSGQDEGGTNISEYVTVDEALFDGRTLFAKVTVADPEQKSLQSVLQDALTKGETVLMRKTLASFRVNGAEQALIDGWATAQDGVMVYEFLYECEPAGSAQLNVDLSSEAGSGTLNIDAQAADMTYCAASQLSADGLPALTSGGAVAGEGFAYVKLYFAAGTESERAELIEWLATATLSVDGDAQARVSSRVVADGLTLGMMFPDGLPQSFTLNAHGADGVDASATYELSATEAKALSELTRVDLPETNDAQPTPEQTGAADAQPTPEQTGAADAQPTPEPTGAADAQPTPEPTDGSLRALGDAGNTPSPSRSVELQTEGQYDGRGLVHIAIEADSASAQLGSVSVNTGDGAQPRLLAMRTERGDDSMRYDLLYQCGQGDMANVRASVDGVAFAMEIPAGDGIGLDALYGEDEALVGWAVESGGVYFGRACLTAAEDAYGALADAQVECVDGEDTNMRAALELSDGAWLNVSGYGALPDVMEFMINGARIALDVAVTADAEDNYYYQFDDGRYLYPGAVDETADVAPTDVQTDTADVDETADVAPTDVQTDTADVDETTDVAPTDVQTDTIDVDETTAIAADELAELQLTLNDSAYDGEYLYVDYELAMPGRYLYDVQISELNGEDDSPYMPIKGAVAVTQALVDTVSGSTELLWSRVERTGADGGALRYTEVYRCLSAQSMGLYAVAEDTAGSHDDSYTAWLELDELEQSGRIRVRDVTQVDVPDDIMIMNVDAFELDGQLLLGVRYRPSAGDVLTADGVNAMTLYGAGEAGTAHTVNDGAGEPIWFELWELYEAVPEDGEITLQLERAGGEGGEVVLKLLATPELSVVESAREGEYVYALVELTPQDGVQLNYSAEANIAALQPDAGQQVDLYVTADAELEALLSDELTSGDADNNIGNEADATTGVIGGADGSTSIYVGPQPTDATDVTDEAPEVIGGADGSTSIYVGPQPTDSSEAADEALEVIGGADGPTAIYTSDGPTSIYTADSTTDSGADAAASIGIIGGADGPTAIYVTSTGMAVTMPRLTQDGRDITLGVADVTESTEGAQGALRLALVGRAEGEGQLALELRAGGTRLSAGLDLPASDEETAPGERREGAGEAVGGAEIELARTVDIGGLRLLEVELDVTGTGLTGAGSGELMRVDGADIAIFTGDALPERLWFAGVAADEADAQAYSWRAAWQTDAAGEVDYRVYQLLPGDADAADIGLMAVWQKAYMTALELAGQLDMTGTEQYAQDAQ